MLFNSLTFGIFLTIAYILYWAFFRKNVGYRNIFLLVVSYFFYGWWNWKLLPLIAGISAVDYFAGMLIAREREVDGKTKQSKAKQSWSLPLPLTWGYSATSSISTSL